MKRSDFRFFHRLRVRWAEVDMQKIVFNAHYLMYFDTAIADYWRALAMPYDEAMALLGGDIFLKKGAIEFHASARMDDRLDLRLAGRVDQRHRDAAHRLYGELAGDKGRRIGKPHDRRVAGSETTLR